MASVAPQAWTTTHDSTITLDDCLSIRDGHLYIEDCDTVELAARFGTPLNVVSEAQLRSNARRYTAAYTGGWPNGRVNILPSIKANYSLALRHILSQEGMGCDTFGASELHAAIEGGVRPALISVNGSIKDAELIDRAVKAGARITLDSARELDLVADAAQRTGRVARIRFRVRPSYTELRQATEFVEEDVPIFYAANAYKPGIPTEDLPALGPRAFATDGVEVTGVMVHLGRHHRDLAVWRAMIASFAHVVEMLLRAWDGWEPHEIDVGGGFATRRDPFGRAMARNRDRPQGDHAPSIEDYARCITSALDSELRHRGVDPTGKTLEVEPGRSMYADSGIHLATVRNVKQQSRPVAQRWIEVDTSEAFLPDVIVEHSRFAHVVANKADRAPEERADIVGKSCGFDLLSESAAVPEVGVGDVVAFLDTGAYQDAVSNNFNAMARPATVLVNGAGAEIIKRAETVADVFSRDVIPQRLAAAGPSEP
ncbi:MAG: alanine racemase [Actinomycetota bacterium]|nr:alanine racemase [Actinomycetota bacterium]